MPEPELNFQLLFEESPDVLLVLKPDSPRFTAVAATKARLTSTHSTAEQTIGRGLFEMFPDNPDDPSANATANLRASLERVLATRAPDTMAVQKYDIPLPDGGFEAKYWSPRNIPILAADGTVLYILHRAVDVTELARASEEGEELRGRTADMEREVVRRSRELDAANRQMRAANEKLSHLDAAKTAFFSNISHEFRTPLTLMLGPLEDSLADAAAPLAPAQRQRLKLAHDNALRLLKLVNALLDFSRLEAGRLRGRFAPVDLATQTHDLAMMFQAAFERAGLRLDIDCPPLSNPFWVDQDMWEKILPNLISNAFKFTLAGAVTVRLRQTATHAVLEVIDTGTGIPEAELPRVFERFHRVAGATGRTHEGAGIGLALVRELVELHGGGIEVESQLGVGTTFRVAIPAGHAHLPPDTVLLESPADQVPNSINAHATEAVRLAELSGAANAVPAEPAGAAAQHEDQETLPLVLVVDDNADLRDYMSGLLSPHYRVVTAQDGLEALELIRARTPDIVVSDVMMPRMTGIELVQALRTESSESVVPVILLSARAGEEATIEGLDAGSDDYLTKPFTASELLARVRSHVKLGQARRRWTAELETANRELDAFSYSVAHDLRGPLRSIDGFSQMLLEAHGGQLDADGRRHLDIVRGSAQRMSRVIDDLLRLAQMSRGAVRRIGFELSSLVRTVALHLSQSEPQRRVELLIEPGVHVDADPHLLQIVLDNLMRNAWKFTAKRAQAVIEFGAEEINGETSYFLRDNGAGFNMKYASKLFGVFQRLHADSEFQGTGVGLATVKRIIGRHGGRVWAVGEVDRGATFYFTLTAVAVSGALGQSSTAA
jgi:signal transduction histidine kinase